LPSILALIIGRWSDVHGRKWPLTIAAIGMGLCYSAYLTLTFFPLFCSEHPWVLFLPSIPVAFGGNIPVFTMASFSYLGDIFIINKSSNKEKLYRYLICEACCAFGAPVGVYLGGWLFRHYGHWVVFIAAAFIEFVAALYSLIRIRNDSVELAMVSLGTDNPSRLCNDKQETCGSVPKKKPLNLLKMFTANFRSRKGSLRTIVILMVLCQSIATANYNLGSAIDYIYIKYKLNWTLQMFSEWKASYIAVAAIGAISIAPGLAYCVSEPLQAALAFLFCGIFTFVVGTVTISNSWLLWMALIFPVLFLVPTSVARTVITRIVDVDELGSVFGLIAFIGGLTPMIMSTVGSSIFNYAVAHKVNVGIVYFCASSLHFTGFTVSLITDVLWWSNKKLVD
jgi:MFS family permease